LSDLDLATWGVFSGELDQALEQRYQIFLRRCIECEVGHIYPCATRSTASRSVSNGWAPETKKRLSKTIAGTPPMPYS